MQLGHGGELRTPVASGHDEYDRFRWPTGNETEDLGRLRIRPLHIVDQADEWSFLGSRRQEAPYSKAEKERICVNAHRQPERNGQGGVLRAGKAPEPVEKRHAQLVQRGERKLHLRFDGRHVHYSTP